MSEWSKGLEVFFWKPKYRNWRLTLENIISFGLLVDNKFTCPWSCLCEMFGSNRNRERVRKIGKKEMQFTAWHEKHWKEQENYTNVWCGNISYFFSPLERSQRSYNSDPFLLECDVLLAWTNFLFCFKNTFFGWNVFFHCVLDESQTHRLVKCMDCILKLI